MDPLTLLAVLAVPAFVTACCLVGLLQLRRSG
jgi:hypothetical protein